MSVVFTMKNIHTIGDAADGGVVCRFDVRRYARIDPALNLDVETPCRLCVLPGGRCNLVHTERLYHVDNPLANWDYQFTNPDHQTLFESSIDDYDLTYDVDEKPGCHWTGEDNGEGGGVTYTQSRDLEITINASDSSLIDMTLTITGAFTGAFSDSHEVTYELTGVDPTDLGPHTLTATTERTWDLPSTDFIEFPETFELTPEDFL